MTSFRLFEPTRAEMGCAVCGGHDATVVGLRGRDGEALRSVACRQCGLVWSDPRPHDVRQFYEHDYRQAYKKVFTPRPKHVLRAGRVALDRWSRIRDLLRPGARVLDVGSGGGEFAHLLARLGCRVTGIEPNIGYAEHAARSYGLDVRRGFVDEVAIEPQSIEVVTIWHVLEHTEDPLAVLRQLRRVLVPEGRLVVEVPNIEATCQSPRSTFHAAHLVHFNVATLSALAARAGLRVVRHALSPDGGNLTMVLQPDAHAVELQAPAKALPGNYERVVAVLAAHRPLAHALRPATAWRALRRIGRALGERVALWRLGGDASAADRSLLDRVYDEALESAAPTVAPTSGNGGRFALLGTAALVLGWWLESAWVDDAAARGWSESTGVVLYVTLQVALIAVLAVVARRIGGSRQRLGVLGLLLLAMPVLH
jgi:2-polyprenyl-3-methyl-5-hydroxy-6-metoxy-1,4-benzoquinol methylase